MNRTAPIPRFGVPAVVRPIIQIPITLYFHERDGMNWNGRGEPATKGQLKKEIDQCRGQHIPNDLLPALDPGDVIVLVDGVFWIDRHWKVQPYELPESQKHHEERGSAIRGTRSRKSKIDKGSRTHPE